MRRGIVLRSSADKIDIRTNNKVVKTIAADSGVVGFEGSGGACQGYGRWKSPSMGSSPGGVWGQSPKSW